MKEGKVLADVYGQTRLLTHWYISKLKGQDVYLQIECNGVFLNSIYWLTAHLLWAEQNLLIKGLGKENMGLEWLNEFGIGSSSKIDLNSVPGFKEVLDNLKSSHEMALEIVSSIEEPFLDKDNILGVQFGGDKSNRMLIQHAIRHEGIHSGHLGWLCKLNGIQLI